MIMCRRAATGCARALTCDSSHPRLERWRSQNFLSVLTTCHLCQCGTMATEIEERRVWKAPVKRCGSPRVSENGPLSSSHCFVLPYRHSVAPRAAILQVALGSSSSLLKRCWKFIWERLSLQWLDSQEISRFIPPGHWHSGWWAAAVEGSEMFAK